MCNAYSLLETNKYIRLHYCINLNTHIGICIIYALVFSDAFQFMKDILRIDFLCVISLILCNDKMN